MNGNVKRIEKWPPLQVEQLPEGVYSGVWGGYEVMVSIAGENYRLETSEGVRGINVPCSVTVANGQVNVEAK